MDNSNKAPLISSPRQGIRLSGECGTGKPSGFQRDIYNRERFQVGLIKLTHTGSGVLTLTSGAEVNLFVRGVGGESVTAGWPASSTFTEALTNVDDTNGLQGLRISAIGFSLGQPFHISSGVITDAVAIDGYRDAVMRLVSTVISVRSEQGGRDKLVHSFGALHRNVGDRGSPSVGTFAQIGAPVPQLVNLTDCMIDVPFESKSDSSKPFALYLKAEHGISIPTRSTAIAADLYVPVICGMEVRQLEGADFRATDN